jgi:RHS repeat-associated protein
LWTTTGDGTNTSSFAYTAFDQLTSAQNSQGRSFSQFLYDANGNVTWARNQSNAGYTFSYNARNELVTITDPAWYTSYLTYNLAGQKSGLYAINGYSLYGYDGVGRLQSDAFSYSGYGQISSTTYGYNTDDSLASKTVSIPGNASSGVHSYTYDAADRLKTWAGPQGSVTYGYDNAGNRTSAGSQSFGYDQRNRLLTGPSSTYSWAARGTPSTQSVGGVTTSYTTDAADRTTGVSKSGSVLTYGFDSLDRVRFRSVDGTVSEEFTYDGFQTDPSSSVHADGNSNRYIRKPSGELYGQVFGNYTQGTSRYQVGLDIHGDAAQWIISAGVVGSKQYDPFGAVTNTSGSNYMNLWGANLWTIGYQGDYTDPTTGDVNMGARWYNPSTATFRSRDTYMGTLQTPFSLNRYTYGLNNPLRYNDPTGHYAEHAGCYRDDRSYDWDCDHAANNAGEGVETDHPLYENADGTTKTNIFDVVDLGGGDSQISVTSSAGTTVSTNTSTVRTGTHAAGATEVSGNLSYTPKAATDEERIISFKQGNTPNAIADAAHDDRKAQGANPSQHASVGSAGTRFLSGSFNNYSMVNPAIAACLAAGPAAPECAAAVAAGTVVIVGGVYIAKNGKKIGAAVVAASKEVASGVNRAWNWVWNETSDPPVAGAVPGRVTKGKTKQWEKEGDFGQANEDFDAKSPVDVFDLPFGGRVGTLPDGRTIVVRPTSSPGTSGPPTLEIQDGDKKVKVRYQK